MALDRDDRRIIGKDLQKVEFGWPVGMPYCRNLEKGLWEVRSNLSHGRIARVIFTIVDDRMLLLHGFVKKSRKTPGKELDIAMKRCKEAQKQ